MGGIAPGLGQNLWVTALVLLACVLSLWLLSIRLRDASIIDIFWGPAFGIVALVGYALGDGHGVEVRRALITVLTILWAARLGIYLYWRNHGKGEDPRYTAAYRNRFPTNLHWHTLTKVFLLQGTLVWLISMPVQFAQYLALPPLRPPPDPFPAATSELHLVARRGQYIAAIGTCTLCHTAGPNLMRPWQSYPEMGGGLRVNDKPEPDANRTITAADLADGVVKLAAGKKKIVLVRPV